MAGKPARMCGASGYIMWAFAKAPQISSPSATTTRSSLFETQSLCHWTSHRSGSRPLSARPTCCFSAACSSWSTDSLPLSGDSFLREPSIKERKVVANAAPFLSLCRWQTRRVCFMLGRRPRWNNAHWEGMSPLQWYGSLLSALTAPRPSHPPYIFLPETCYEKAVGQRISAPGDEWAFAGCKLAYLTLSPQRDFSRSLHPPWPASLCVCERSGLVRWERWRPVGRQPFIGRFRCRWAGGLVQRPRPLAVCAAQCIQPRHGCRSFSRPV